MVRLNPAAFHWLWRICSMSARRLLPAVDLIWIVAGWPPLAQMPSGPLVQPALVISWVTLLRSRLYFAYGVTAYWALLGGMELCNGFSVGSIGPNSWLTIVLRSVA